MALASFAISRIWWMRYLIRHLIRQMESISARGLVRRSFVLEDEEICKHSMITRVFIQYACKLRGMILEV